jgi:hypothetical protein
MNHGLRAWWRASDRVVAELEELEVGPGKRERERKKKGPPTVEERRGAGYCAIVACFFWW